MSTTFDDICTFCHEVDGQAGSNLFFDLALGRSRGDYILHESDHFVVMPCIGALTDWYLLIVAKRHTLSVGWLDETERADLRHLITEVTELLHERTGLRSLVFEHGSLDFRNKGGACYDHTHVHVVATDRDHHAFLDQIPPPVAMQQCPDWITSAHRLVQEQQRSYLALGTPGQDWIGQANGAPSQFFRRCLATWMGAEEGTWDWLVFPQAERVQRMITDFPRKGTTLERHGRGPSLREKQDHPPVHHEVEDQQFYREGGAWHGAVRGATPRRGDEATVWTFREWVL